MSTAHTGTPLDRRPLRLWPGVVLAGLLVLVRILIPAFVPELRGGIAVIGAIACSLAVIVWWLFFSRASWVERLAAIALMIVALLVTRFVVHPSISNGMMGMMPVVFGLPLLSLALVASVAAARRLPSGRRMVSIAAGIVLACGLMTLVRTDGVSGEGESDLHWRWTPTPEERLLAQSREEPLAPATASAAPASTEPAAAAAAPATAETPDKAAAPKEVTTAAPAPRRDTADKAADPVRADRRVRWPGFRGPARDGVVRGVRIETDWASSPPAELWRRPIGPGWSSFAVSGDLIYTQEQRGNHEVVSAYRLSTGEPVWRHLDAVRFYESNAGPGPRATPTVSGGRVYTMGATGIVNALDAATGARRWSRNAATDAQREIPDWGLASSPLVLDDLVIVGVAGRLVAYDAATGKPRWLGPTGGGGYSSPHLVTIGGVPQILLLRGARTTSVSPRDGTVLWEHTGEPAVSIVQPAVTPEGDVLVAPGDAMGGLGVRRIAVTRDSGGAWSVHERWATRGLKPYFNDYVIHEGHAFGFDGSILACIELTNGERRWKNGRFGHGQLLLLADQDLLLVLSEEGELALIGATADAYRELARFKAIEGKTWNHPVLVDDVLLVRNGEEMAAFRLRLAGR